nr:uncharacterized protein LOC109157845 [Ipomoea batatas]
MEANVIGRPLSIISISWPWPWPTSTTSLPSLFNTKVELLGKMGLVSLLAVQTGVLSDLPVGVNEEPRLMLLEVWKKIRDIIGFPKQTIAIRSTIKWIHRLYKGSRKHDRGVAIALACSVYHIWRFRNLVVHEAVGFNLDGLGYAPLSLYCSICFGPSCASSRLRKQKHWMYAVYPLFRATFVLLFVEMQAYTLGVSVCDQAASIPWMIPYLLHYLVLDIGIIRIPVSHQFSPQYVA